MAQLEYLFQLRRGEGRVEGHRNIASHHDGQIGKDPMVAVFGYNADVVAGQHTDTCQCCCHASSLCAGFCPGDGFPIVAVGLPHKNGIGLLALPLVEVGKQGVQVAAFVSLQDSCITSETLHATSVRHEMYFCQIGRRWRRCVQRLYHDYPAIKYPPFASIS